eukprot:gb/GECG01010652.1/.p1 GENE.gb/GECG01010652.1/~~gb/GECG01010652.1/.p1  ORF type:complete len:121 (+),score=6.27 gb/GECG01010652.1/:1-363(+)
MHLKTTACWMSLRFIKSIDSQPENTPNAQCTPAFTMEAFLMYDGVFTQCFCPFLGKFSHVYRSKSQRVGSGERIGIVTLVHRSHKGTDSLSNAPTASAAGGRKTALDGCLRRLGDSNGSK